MAVHLDFEILPQPDGRSCGPTCLHAIYQYYGDEIPLDQVVREAPMLPDGGTLAVLLACHALRRGYRATIYTYNLHVFDPSWFNGTHVDLRARLKQQLDAKRRDPGLRETTTGYLDYLELGGQVRYEDLTRALIRAHLTHGRPILTGLSATYLYREMREHGPRDEEDDVRGLPAGHFVVLCGYDRAARQVMVADPLQRTALTRTRRVYPLHIDRVLGAIFLGVLTYDANLLLLEPPASLDRGSRL
jgi:hypothetical protein